MAGGGVPDAAIIVVLAGLVAWAGTAVAARTAAWGMFGLLGVSQVSLHVLLTYVSDHDTPPLTSAMIAAHAVATGVTAVLLTSADAMLDLVAASLVGLTRVLLWTPKPPDAPLLPAPSDFVRFVQIVFQRAQPRRGPPLFS
ncbi:hypothetical protein [Alloactinosynnema sp. L-07]|uniref:hypothetical protein n=1 Tax=Alloactinosynnema sp. L-07 TaxID=1653480 RepID=UPI0012FCF8B8|nr:hypothetical protein [Alloactinosynnema sp. L-07]